MAGRDFVLVSGAWQGAWLWEAVVRELEALGHRAHPVTLSGLADRDVELSTIGPQVHVDDVLAVLSAADLRDVILVGHLYGGVVVGQVADRVPERVARVVYVEGFTASDGKAMLDSITPEGKAAELAGIAEHSGRWMPPTAEDLSAEPDLSPQQRAWLLSQFTPHPGRTVAEPLALRRPLAEQVTTYIAASAGSHSSTAEVAAMRNAPLWTFRTVQAGHWPMVSVPAELVSLLVEAARTPSWRDATQRLAAADTYWLATTRQDGRPHLVPVLGVFVDGALHFAAGPATVKGRNIARDPRCVVSTRHRELDFVVEGVAAQVADADTLRRVAQEYLAKYAWPVTVEDGAFIGDGAPTAGPPPYHVYRLAPALAFGLPADDTFAPARWAF